MAKITCIVNNTAKKDSGLRSEHGLAFWIEIGSSGMLFDAGQTEAVLSHNMAMLGLKGQKVKAVVFSHAHYDHTGGLEAVLSGNTDLTIYAHTDIFRPRYSLREGKYQSIGLSLTQADLASRAKLSLSHTPTEILPDLWTTGEILERLEPEGRSTHHFIVIDETWQPDPYRDDLSLVLKTQKGLVVICGCCHAGLLNTLFHVQKMFKRPIIAVLGGTHLVNADDMYLEHVIDVFQDRCKHIKFYLNHCTGERAFQKLKSVFGSQVKACPAGTIIHFN